MFKKRHTLIKMTGGPVCDLMYIKMYAYVIVTYIFDTRPFKTFVKF